MRCSELAVSAFKVSSNDEDNNDLKSVILKALLNDFDNTMDAIRLAVQWRDPQIIKFQLQESKEDDPAGLANALEAALITKSSDVVKVASIAHCHPWFLLSTERNRRLRRC